MAEGTNESMESQVVELCEGLAPNPDGPVEPASKLSDLGFDSLMCADLALAMEERWGIRLAESDVESLDTVGDLARLARRKARAVARIPRGIGRLQPFAKRVAGWAFRWQSRLVVQGAEHVPRTGPVIIAANHRSMLDIPLLVLASPRPVTFMAKEELFRFRFLRWAFHVLGGFPVRREVGDVRAIDIGLGVLEQGEVLGLYPEGRRSKSGEMLPFLEGAAWMALRAGAPIVPCGIGGTERPFGSPKRFRKRVTISFGRAIPVERENGAAERRARAAAVTSELLAEISSLLA